MTKLEIKDSVNYAAQVIRVPEPSPLPNADRLVGLGIFGYTVITAKDGDIHAGDLAVFFPAEAQLSDKLTRGANLYRHADLNEDETQSGYLEDNRRVRALKLRGTVSSGLLLPVSVVARVYGVNVDSLTEGASFDHINSMEVSRKYRIKEPQVHDRSKAQAKKAFRRVTDVQLPEHFETSQWLRNEGYFDGMTQIIVTQKLHGSSVRLGNVQVARELKWWERALVRLGVKISDTGYDTVAGSRKVIKDPNNPNQNHFYASDIWTEKLKEVESRIPKGFVLYGELVGFTSDGAAIQKGHTYTAAPGTADLYLYRVAYVNPDGFQVDLSWDQVRGFAKVHGFAHVPELWRGDKGTFFLDNFIEKDFHDEHLTAKVPYYDEPVALSKGGTGKDEGIAIRIDQEGLNPLLFKYKNDSHYVFETKELDNGVIDIESQES